MTLTRIGQSQLAKLMALTGIFTAKTVGINGVLSYFAMIIIPNALVIIMRRAFSKSGRFPVLSNFHRKVREERKEISRILASLAGFAVNFVR